MFAGVRARIKESLIAVEVFNRKPDYDPKQDSIVRTEAGRLRARLAEYYTGEGGAEPIIIELPKGGYIPTFRRIQFQAGGAGDPRWRPLAHVGGGRRRSRCRGGGLVVHRP